MQIKSYRGCSSILMSGDEGQRERDRGAEFIFTMTGKKKNRWLAGLLPNQEHLLTLKITLSLSYFPVKKKHNLNK